MKLLPVFIAVLILAGSQAALAADPGETWFTEGAALGMPPEGVQWLLPTSLCPVRKAKLAEAVQALESKSFEALDLKTHVAYAGVRCKGKYGQRPYLVRAVSAAGEGHLDAGLLKGQVWMHYAGLGGRYPFEKTPVVLWLYAVPTEVHVTASIVE